MWAILICAAIWLGFALYWGASSIRAHRTFEIYAGCGIGICLTLLILGLSGWVPPQPPTPLRQVLHGAGSLLYLASLLLVVLSFIALGRQGRPRGFIERTTVLVDRGLFGVIRHPLYLGLALFSLGLVLKIQAVLPAVVGLLALGCFWMAARFEDRYNVEKFGDPYKAYMDRVPTWNLWKGLRRKL